MVSMQEQRQKSALGVSLKFNGGIRGDYRVFTPRLPYKDQLRVPSISLGLLLLLLPLQRLRCHIEQQP